MLQALRVLRQLRCKDFGILDTNKDSGILVPSTVQTLGDDTSDSGSAGDTHTYPHLNILTQAVSEVNSSSNQPHQLEHFFLSSLP